MKIEYSYGFFMGYFMKYLGGIFLAAFSVLFMLIVVLVFNGSLLNKMPIKFGLFVLICFCMVWLLAWGSYYCFRYSNLFTKKFIFNGLSVSILDDNGSSNSFKNILIERVVYRVPLFVFEIYFKNSEHKSIIIMNNASKNESEEFLKVKELLKTHNNFSTKWW